MGQGVDFGESSEFGIHFQDAVGAWLASRLASGDLATDHLIPEGLDDLQIDGPVSVQMEVKSRQGRLGPFPIGHAAHHIVDAWIRHSDRFGSTRRLVIVLEQGLDGFEHDPDRTLTEIPIARLVEEVGNLREALTGRIESQKRPSTVVQELEACTTLIVGSWDDVLSETDHHIGRQLQPGFDRT